VWGYREMKARAAQLANLAWISKNGTDNGKFCVSAVLQDGKTSSTPCAHIAARQTGNKHTCDIKQTYAAASEKV
jgi:hypothetical protein